MKITDEQMYYLNGRFDKASVYANPRFSKDMPFEGAVDLIYEIAMEHGRRVGKADLQREFRHMMDLK